MNVILQKRIVFYVISGVLFLLSLISFFSFNLNLGIDMTGGTQTEFAYNTYTLDLQKIDQEAKTVKDHINLSGDIINNVNVYKVSGENIFVVEAGFNPNTPEEQLETYKVAYKNQLEEAYKDMGDITVSRYTNIGASFGDYIKKTAFITLLLAIIGIAIYVGYAFSGTISGIPSWSFAAITIITLFNDVFISAGFYILTSHFLNEFKIDTFFVTALLTILGYSINDTIVVFDRIRANLKLHGGKGKDLFTIISESMNEVFTRSLYTSLTVFVVLLAIFIWGPESISGFTLAMIYGTVVGTFSSICLASPLLYDFNKNKTLKVYKKKEYKPEDKIVV